MNANLRIVGCRSVAVLTLHSATAKATSFTHAKLVGRSGVLPKGTIAHATAIQTVETLQAYFPERLGRCFVNNAPFWVSIIMKLIHPFMDTITRSKIAVNRDFIAQGDFTRDQLAKEWGGERELGWDCERYFAKLIEISGMMKEKRIAKWRELGGKVGLREWDYKEE